MEDGHHRQHGVEDEDGENEEEQEVNVEVVDDPVVRNGVDDDLREHEIRLNAIGFEADVVALRDPIAINLGTPAYPIEVGDLPIHGFEFEEILLTCPPLQEEEA